jgi:hypothetical protein
MTVARKMRLTINQRKWGIFMAPFIGNRDSAIRVRRPRVLSGPFPSVLG